MLVGAFTGHDSLHDFIAAEAPADEEQVVAGLLAVLILEPKWQGVAAPV